MGEGTAAAGSSTKQQAAAPAVGVGDPRAEALRCPRCDSANTKFCYYNNYSLAQPRHFCKACKRYWTRGGTLRNVPVGGGCRKNKRSRKHSSSSSTSSTVAAHGAASSSLPPSSSSTPPSSLPLSAALNGLPSSSLASLFLANSDFNLFQAIQSVPDASSFDLQQPQGLDMLGLGYGVGQLHIKPPPHNAGGGGGLMDSYLSPFLSSSLVVPSLDELQTTSSKEQAVKAEAGEHWHLAPCEVISTSDALMTSAANPAGNSSAVLPGSTSLMYWNNGGIGGATTWPDMANYGSSVAPLF